MKCEDQVILVIKNIPGVFLIVDLISEIYYWQIEYQHFNGVSEGSLLHQ